LASQFKTVRKSSEKKKMESPRKIGIFMQIADRDSTSRHGNKISPFSF
jgi:hypothetical protein